MRQPSTFSSNTQPSRWKGSRTSVGAIGVYCGITCGLSLDLALRDRVYPLVMAREGLLIGEVAKRSGASRKALRLYEQAGILPATPRTEAGFRVFGADVLHLVAFVRQAQRLGFTLKEIQEIVSIQRSGGRPCPHVHGRVLRKRADLDRRLADLADVRKRLDAVLRGWQSRCGTAAACLHIEQNGDPRRPSDHIRNPRRRKP
jgi:MerR family transcriptional regulator, copper efflux regulator